MNYKNLLLFLIPFLLIVNSAAAQTVVLNGDFSKIDPATKLPQAWNNFMGDKDHYDFAVDNVPPPHGKHGMIIASKSGDAGFGAVSCVIPYGFEGKSIRLKGYLKTEDVSGFAGFWLRVDGTTAFSNMQNKNIHGTTDWTEYTIVLPYDDESAININAGALLSGKGKVWFSDVRVDIDGTPVEKLKPGLTKMTNAQKDTAFLAGSGIADFTPNDQQVKNLALLGQVWGFVKYHLPKVKAGDVNMDAELFRVMPDVINAGSYADAGAAIEKWLDRLGAPAPCSDCKPFDAKNVAHKPDYGEIFDQSVVSASLAGKLEYILKNNKHSKSYYIAGRPAGNPDFTHEANYVKMVYPDAGYRLLALFRYWNMIQYFYPYKHLIGEDWSLVLSRMIPQFLEAKSAMDYDIAAMTLIASIHDTHANIWSNQKGLNEYRGKFSPPFQAKFIEDKLVVTAYYNDVNGVKDNFKIGDVITAINGVPVRDLIKKFLPVTAASNYETQLRDMPNNYLLRSRDSVFAFDIVRDGKTIAVKQTGLPLGKINFAAVYNPNPDDPSYHLMANGQIGYEYPGRYHNKELPDIKELFKNTKGIIVDMRSYPSDVMPFTFGSYIKSGDAGFVKFTSGSIDYPGLFTVGVPLKVPAANEYKGKVVVIVNETSQSAAEYTTMAFQSSPNVTVIGSRTAGADGNVSQITLPGGISTMISGLDVLYPDGTETQRVGVKINEVDKPTIAGVKAGKDELLDRAQAIILGE